MINRRELFRISGIAASGSLLLPSMLRGQQAQKNKQNLLIIHTDEHNFRTLGCYREQLSDEQAYIWGKEAILETPNIDWLAKNGAICNKFYATSPVCSPSRGAFISGRYPQNTPVTGNDIPLNDDVISFAETLGKNGYMTGYAGKWHLDGGAKPGWGPKRQFGFKDNRYMYNRGHWKVMIDTPIGPKIGVKNDNGKPSYSIKGATNKTFTTDYLADKTIEFIDKHKDKPFCYMVSIPDPHGPNSVRAPYDTMYKDLNFSCPKSMNAKVDSTPKWAPKSVKKMNNNAMQKYFGMVKCIDDNIGRILKSLRLNGLINNTIIIFTSDHGDLCGEHGRHNKGVPFEASAKVPFVIYHPKKIKAGTIVNDTVSCVDFLPTILSIMDVKTAGKEEGRDTSKLFIDGKAPANWNDITFMRACDPKPESTWISAVTKRYKLIYSKLETPWFYDLKKDPNELKNLFLDPKYRDIIRGMSKQLVEYGKKFNDITLENSLLKADIAWVISDSEKFTPQKRVITKKKTRKKPKKK